MVSRLYNWWKTGEERAISVYRARFLVPLILLTAIEALAYLVTLPHTLKDIWLFPLTWAVCVIPLLLRRRRAAIFTPDTFMLRPAFGAPLRIPIGGIKRVTLLDTAASEEYPIPTAHIELIVGGSLDVRLGVSNPTEIIQRLDASAGDRGC